MSQSRPSLEATSPVISSLVPTPIKTASVTKAIASAIAAIVVQAGAHAGPINLTDAQASDIEKVLKEEGSVTAAFYAISNPDGTYVWETFLNGRYIFDDITFYLENFDASTWIGKIWFDTLYSGEVNRYFTETVGYYPGGTSNSLLWKGGELIVKSNALFNVGEASKFYRSNPTPKNEIPVPSTALLAGLGLGLAAAGSRLGKEKGSNTPSSRK